MTAGWLRTVIELHYLNEMVAGTFECLPPLTKPACDQV
jgi:hypothetical protein